MPYISHARVIQMRSLKSNKVTVWILLSLLSCSAGYASPVSLNSQGNLVYTPDSNGNIIPDFSYSGYQKSERAIPNIEVVRTIAPVAGDNTQHIQNAINQIASLPINQDGFRGALLLTAGTYSVSGQLFINDSGIVLRGQGQSESGTVIIAAGTDQRSLIVTQGDLSRSERTFLQEKITDNYVPVGTRTFSIADTQEFFVGQSIIVYRPGTDEWISSIGMDRIEPRSSGGEITQWIPNTFNFRFEREITEINGNTITIDIPIVQMMEERHGGGYIYPVETSGRISNIGVENMLLVSEFEAGQENEDEDHAWIGIEIIDTEHSWVSDITARHFGYALASVERGSRFITVRDSNNVDPVSRITGSRRYSFNLDGSLSLFLRCTSNDGRHDFVTGSRVTGPNAFVYGEAIQTHSDIGPHHRWAMGTLFDNISGGELNIQDRGNFGSGHGWAGAQQVFWNTEGSIQTAVQSPPGAINWSIGHTGPRWEGRHSRPQGEWISHNQKVLPESLFVKQLEERIGVTQAAAVLKLDVLADPVPSIPEMPLILMVPSIVESTKEK